MNVNLRYLLIISKLFICWSYNQQFNGSPRLSRIYFVLLSWETEKREILRIQMRLSQLPKAEQKKEKYFSSSPLFGVIIYKDRKREAISVFSPSQNG